MTEDEDKLINNADLNAAIAKAVADAMNVQDVAASQEITVDESQVGASIDPTTPFRTTHNTTSFQNLQVKTDPPSVFVNALHNSTEWDGTVPDPKGGDIVRGPDMYGNVVSVGVVNPLGQASTQQPLANSTPFSLPANPNYRPDSVDFQGVMTGVEFDFIELECCIGGTAQTRTFPVLKQ